MTAPTSAIIPATGLTQACLLRVSQVLRPSSLRYWLVSAPVGVTRTQFLMPSPRTGLPPVLPFRPVPPMPALAAARIVTTWGPLYQPKDADMPDYGQQWPYPGYLPPWGEGTI